MLVRLKRLRRTANSRALVQENHLAVEQLIAPLFVNALISSREAIKNMPGQFQYPLEEVLVEIEELSSLGIQAVLLFGIPPHKDANGSYSLQDDGIVQQAIRLIKQHYPHMIVIADACFCDYTDHGHCGVLKGDEIDNDATLQLLGQQALSFAKAGADWIAPSGMTDGMVLAIRQALDRANHTHTAILSYAAKYCSCFYGPFREILGVKQSIDRKSYQMNPGNSDEAVREVALDIQEGADAVMVKPAMSYLDIVYRIRHEFPATPLCAYQVSGEYTMLKLAAQQGIINEEQAILESLLSIKRAGANFIITYFAKQFAQSRRDQTVYFNKERT